MMRSLFSAVSGLRAHQTKMDVIGNNISNVNTVAYKAQGVTFRDVYYQTTQTATGPNNETGKGGTNAMQIGLGASVGAISTRIGTQGASERTDNPWDLMISGDSFFIVESAGTTYFTRAGDFTTDMTGALVTQTGANVMGWKVDPDTGEIIKDQVQPLYATSPEFMYTNPAVTTANTLTGNIDARSTSDSVFTINFYDTLGNEYQAALTLSYVDPAQGGAATDGIAEYVITGSSVTKNGEPTALSISANKNMTFNSLTGVAMVENADITLTITDTNPDGSIQMENIGIPNADGTSNLTLDATGVTMFADATDLKSSKGINGEGAGKAVGKMTSVGVDQSGKINASYSNGDVKVIGQIAVTTFANPAGLEKVGENLYAATLNSGLFDGIGQDITENDGKMSSGYLEMSNVDLAEQFTTMITTQRGYQANSRIISVSDSLLEEVVNLKR